MEKCKVCLYSADDDDENSATVKNCYVTPGKFKHGIISSSNSTLKMKMSSHITTYTVALLTRPKGRKSVYQQINKTMFNHR